MNKFWQYQFSDSIEQMEVFDEAPLWSSLFGEWLLEHLPMNPVSNIVDIGSGAGFPLLELASRFGPDVKCYGVDAWSNANARARMKAERYNLKNVEIIESNASNLPFGDNEIELMVSNLGMNNFSDKESVFLECHRVLKIGSKLALTTNMNGHWSEFYQVFAKVLEQFELIDSLKAMREQEAKRGNVQSISNVFKTAGFEVIKAMDKNVSMRFSNGTAFLNHPFILKGWMESWVNLVDVEKRESVFKELEIQLNHQAMQDGELKLSVPMLYIEAIKK